MASLDGKHVLCSRCILVFQTPLSSVLKIAGVPYVRDPAIVISVSDFRHSALVEKCFICRQWWLHLGDKICEWTDETHVSVYYYLTSKCAIKRSPNLLNVILDFETSQLMRFQFQFVITSAGAQDVFPETRHLPNNTGSAVSLNTMKSWMRDCVANHERCRCISNQDFTPSRLLHFGNTKNTWRLHVKSEDGEPSDKRWIALSYQWGQYQQHTLNASTLTSFRAGKKISELPKTFQEVIQVARVLGINYIWIDAMCIMQDSAQDWKHESQQMQHVYGNSFCTVAASWAVDPTGGLFHDRDPLDITSCIVETSWGTEGDSSLNKVKVYARDAWNNQIDKSPLHSRGWAYQERILPSRFLSFTQYQILWDCKEARKCEVFSERPPTEYCDPFGRSQTLRAFLTREKLHEEKEMIRFERFRAWCFVIEAFSRCKLTVPTDKLVALRGITSLFEAYTQDLFLYGIWGSQIFDFLLWAVKSDSGLVTRSSANVAPSWSWASIEGPVQMFGIPEYPFYPFTASVTPDESPEEKMCLLLNGYMPASLPYTVIDPTSSRYVVSLPFGMKVFQSVIELDLPVSNPNGAEATEYYFILLRVGWYVNPVRDGDGVATRDDLCGQGIIVQKVPESADMYVRAGCFGFYKWEKEGLEKFGLQMEDSGEISSISKDRHSTFKLI